MGNKSVIKARVSSINEVLVVIAQDLSRGRSIEIQYCVSVNVDEVVTLAPLEVDNPLGTFSVLKGLDVGLAWCFHVDSAWIMWEFEPDKL